MLYISSVWFNAAMFMYSYVQLYGKPGPHCRGGGGNDKVNVNVYDGVAPLSEVEGIVCNSRPQSSTSPPSNRRDKSASCESLEATLLGARPSPGAGCNTRASAASRRPWLPSTTGGDVPEGEGA